VFISGWIFWFAVFFPCVRKDLSHRPALLPIIHEFELADKVIIVTGASGGIGSAIARKFAAEGARLILHCNANRAKAEKLQSELPGVDSSSSGPTSPKSRRQTPLRRRHQTLQTRRCPRRQRRLLGNPRCPPARNVSQAMAQHPRRRPHSAFLTLREFTRLVAKQKRGSAVLVASTAGVFGEAGHADYASAKAAMAYGLTRTMKNELSRLAPHTADYCGGRINCVCPGWTVVPRNEAKLQDAAVVRKVTATMALPQIGRPDDIAHAVVFLSSDVLARHLTGQTLVVAGGMEGRLLWKPEEIDPTIV